MASNVTKMSHAPTHVMYKIYMYGSWLYVAIVTNICRNANLIHARHIMCVQPPLFSNIARIHVHVANAQDAIH